MQYGKRSDKLNKEVFHRHLNFMRTEVVLELISKVGKENGGVFRNKLKENRLNAFSHCIRHYAECDAE